MALFAGYGGLELGIDAAFGGCRTVCYVERESYAAATLVARMAEEAIHPAPIWDDVTTLDGRPWRGVVDIISAGFPCQPFSAAGKRQGQADERWLWDDIERIIREVQPRWVVGENVSGFVSLGLSAVLRSFASLGYDVVWGAFRASEVGASHQRERIFILARLGDTGSTPTNFHGTTGQLAQQDSACESGHGMADTEEARWRYRRESGIMGGSQNQESRTEHQPASTSHSGERDMADAERARLYRRLNIRLAKISTEDRSRLGHGPAGCRSELADADGIRRWAQGDCQFSSARIDRSNKDLGDPERRRQHGGTEKHPGPNTTTGGRGLFAPGPQDFELWARVLAETPQIEPSVCGMADGSAAELDYRQDRLRACGNGVVPLQAAAAIRALADRAGWDLIP